MAELLATTSSLELSEWMEFAKIEPFGDLQDDLRAGIVASTVANYAGKTLKDDTKPLAPSDFMTSLGIKSPVSEGAILESSPEAQSALIMAAMFGIAPGE